MKKLSVFLVLLFLSSIPAFSSSESVLYVSALVTSILQIRADETNEFLILDNKGDLIPSRMIGNVVIKSSFPTWKLVVDSSYETSSTIGRLKLENSEVYIPYTFGLKNGESLVLNQFNIKSLPQTKTPFEGSEYSLTLYFTDDNTIWPQGTYSDTLVFTVTTD